MKPEEILFAVIMITVFIFGCIIGDTTGTADMRAEAFKRGYMVKQISENDKVIYIWVEPKGETSESKSIR